MEHTKIACPNHRPIVVKDQSINPRYAQGVAGCKELSDWIATLVSNQLSKVCTKSSSQPCQRNIQNGADTIVGDSGDGVNNTWLCKKAVST